MAVEAVRYSGPELYDAIEVRRLHLEELDLEIAQNVLGLMTESYALQFEGPDSEARLPYGTFAKYFQSDEDASPVQMERMRSYMNGGSEYWFAYIEAGGREADDAQLAGMIKFSPSRASLLQKSHIAPPNLFINDIAVWPFYQRLGVGTNLMHTATRYAGYGEEASTALHAYRPNARINQWYEELGFEEKPRAKVDPLELGKGHQLQQVQMGAVALSGIVVALENKHPRLRTARLKGQDY